MFRIIITILTFFIATAQAALNETILPLTFSQDMAATSIQIQGKTIPLLFDTGDAKDAVALSPEALRGIKVNYINEKSCTSTLSGKVCMQEFVIPEIKIGNFVLHNVQGKLLQHLWGGDKGFIETTASKDGLIGLPLLKNFNVLIDYPQAQVVLTPKSKTPTELASGNWTKIPFQIDHNISTEAEVNGTPVKLVWDTGAIPSVMKASTSVKAKTSTCPARYTLDGAPCKRITITSFFINEQRLRNTWFIVKDIPIPFDGLVGSNFYENNLVFLDFQNDEMFIKPFEPIVK